MARQSGRRMAKFDKKIRKKRSISHCLAYAELINDEIRFVNFNSHFILYCCFSWYMYIQINIENSFCLQNAL